MGAKSFIRIYDIIRLTNNNVVIVVDKGGVESLANVIDERFLLGWDGGLWGSQLRELCSSISNISGLSCDGVKKPSSNFTNYILLSIDVNDTPIAVKLIELMFQGYRHSH